MRRDALLWFAYGVISVVIVWMAWAFV